VEKILAGYHFNLRKLVSDNKTVLQNFPIEWISPKIQPAIQNSEREENIALDKGAKTQIIEQDTSGSTFLCIKQLGVRYV